MIQYLRYKWQQKYKVLAMILTPCFLLLFLTYWAVLSPKDSLQYKAAIAMGYLMIVCFVGIFTAMLIVSIRNIRDDYRRWRENQ